MRMQTQIMETSVGLNITIVFYLVLGGLTQAQESEEAAPDLDQKLTEFYHRKQYDDAEKLLRGFLEGSPENVECRLKLAGLLNYVGKVGESIRIMEEGLAVKESPELLWSLGHVWMDRGDDGPNVTRSGGTVTYHPSKMTDEEEEEWKQVEFAKAVDAFRRLLVIDPENSRTASQLVIALQGAVPAQVILEEVNGLALRFPENIEIGLKKIEGLIAEKELKQARALLDGFLEENPREQRLLEKQAEIIEVEGDPETAKKIRKQIAFYQWMPPFAKTEYSPQIADLITTLQSSQDDCKTVVERLLVEKSTSSDELLAAVCFHHLSHGPVENSCFAELEERGRGDLLLALVENPQSICTVREGGRALARMKHPKAFEILTQMLPGDQRPLWISDAATSLELLGDPRAVGILIETADPSFKESERQRSEDEAGFMGEGPLNNRLRCLLALGGFDTQESREALLLGTKNPELALVSEFALYRLTKDLKHFEKGISLVRDDDFIFRHQILPYLEKMKNPEVTQRLVQWKKKNPPTEEK